MRPLARARRRFSHARGRAVGGAAILIEQSSMLKVLNKRWQGPQVVARALLQVQVACRSVLYFKVFLVVKRSSFSFDTVVMLY